MTNPIAVSQQRRRILARQICAWAQSTSLRAKEAEDFACAAIDAFEAEIRADERERAAKVAEQLDMGQSWSTTDTCTRFHTRNAIATAIRNQKDHDHE